MMINFNEDGSLRLPDKVMKQKQEKEDRLRKGRCMLIRKEMVNFTAPKTCVLRIRLSDAFTDSSFVGNIHRFFSESAQSPTKLKKINDKEFDIEIGSNFKRCSECADLIKRFNEMLCGNIIEEKGNCPYKGLSRGQEFCYEDYFD